MVWDEQAGAMVWEDDAAPVAAPPQQANTWTDTLKRIATNPILNPLGAAVELNQGSITAEPSSALAGNVAKSAPLPIIGGLIGGKFAGGKGSMAGASLGEWINQKLGITPESKAAIALSAMPAPATQGFLRGTKAIDSARRTISNMSPSLGAGLAEEAYQKPTQRLQAMSPDKAALDAEYERIRQDPQYTAMGTPTTTTTMSTPPGSMFSPPTPVTTTTPNYPIKLPQALAVAQEEQRKYGGQQRLAPGLADNYTARITKLASEGGTMEDVHGILTELNSDISSATGNDRRILQQYKASIWNDLIHAPLGQELKDNNIKYARYMATQELEAAVQGAVRDRGEIQGANANVIAERLRKTYNDPGNPFIRQAIAPDEFQIILDEVKSIGLDQETTKSNAGSLAAYGSTISAGGGAGAALAQAAGGPAAVGGTIGAGVGLGVLRNFQEKAVRQALSEQGAQKRLDKVARFRQPAQAANINPRVLEAIGQGGVQSIAEMFLRNRGIDPTLQPVEEEQQQYQP